LANEKPAKVVVYSCSGCSSAAQLANHVAVSLDRQGIAEMSCIAGVGGNVKPLVQKAKSGSPIVAIDGCPLACVAHCLSQHGLTPTKHIVLSEFGVKKIQHGDFDKSQAAEVFENAVRLIDDIKNEKL
jgi:uncharacterized metal-binding protein